MKKVGTAVDDIDKFSKFNDEFFKEHTQFERKKTNTQESVLSRYSFNDTS